jgi:hypothetical protein
MVPARYLWVQQLRPTWCKARRPLQYCGGITITFENVLPWIENELWEGRNRGGSAGIVVRRAVEGADPQAGKLSPCTGRQNLVFWCESLAMATPRRVVLYEEETRIVRAGDVLVRERVHCRLSTVETILGGHCGEAQKQREKASLSHHNSARTGC